MNKLTSFCIWIEIWIIRKIKRILNHLRPMELTETDIYTPNQHKCLISTLSSCEVEKKNVENSWTKQTHKHSSQIIIINPKNIFTNLFTQRKILHKNKYFLLFSISLIFSSFIEMNKTLSQINTNKKCMNQTTLHVNFK